MRDGQLLKKNIFSDHILEIQAKKYKKKIIDELIKSNYESSNPVFTNFCYYFFQLLKSEKK